MGKGNKNLLLLLGVGVGAFILSKSKDLKSLKDKLSFNVLKPSGLNISKGVLTTDVQVEFTNNSPVPLKIDSILTRVYAIDSAKKKTVIGSSKPVGSSYSIPANKVTTVTIALRFPLLNLAANLLSIRSIQVGAVPTVLGLDLPEQLSSEVAVNPFSLKI